jgi:hypothetical protein
VAGGDALLRKRFGHFGNELQKRQAGVDVTCTLARFLYESGYVIAGKVEQALKPLRLLVRMDIGALGVFDLSLVLQKLSMTSTTMDS